MDNLTTTNPNLFRELDYRGEGYTAAVIPTFTFIIGSLGNGFVIFVCMKSTKHRESSFLFILNLAITDLITSLTSGLYLLNVFTDIILKSYIGCTLLELLATHMVFVSQFMIAFITLDRYLAICKRDRYLFLMTKRKKRKMIFLTWTLPLAFDVVQIFERNKWDKIHVCIYEIIYPDYLYCLYSTVNFVLIFIVVILYAEIMKKVRDFRRKICPANKNEGNIAINNMAEKKRAIRNGKLMGILTMVFLCCWLPWHVCQYLFGTNISQTVLNASLFTCALGVTNSIVNPFIYAWQKKIFQEEARGLLQYCRRNQMDNQ